MKPFQRPPPFFIFLAASLIASAKGAPDISTVPADLTIPPLTEGKPASGKRVKGVHPDWGETKAHHVIYLPEN